jgi:hypothetical protein
MMAVHQGSISLFLHLATRNLTVDEHRKAHQMHLLQQIQDTVCCYSTIWLPFETLYSLALHESKERQHRPGAWELGKLPECRRRRLCTWRRSMFVESVEAAVHRYLGRDTRLLTGGETPVTSAAKLLREEEKTPHTVSLRLCKHGPIRGDDRDCPLFHVKDLDVAAFITINPFRRRPTPILYHPHCIFNFKISPALIEPQSIFRTACFRRRPAEPQPS